SGDTYYTLTVVSGSGDGSYTDGHVVIITADAAPTGQSFDVWTGNTTGIANVNVASTTIAMPGSNATITATYSNNTYTLSVVSGTGDGTYTNTQVVAITADSAPTGTIFDDWEGDTTGIVDVSDPTTNITMPAANATITATYVTSYILSVISGSGDGDYAAGTGVAIVADGAPTGQAFDDWVGDTTGIADINDPTTTITTQAADATITATYVASSGYTLTVTSGSGDGDYTEGQSVTATAISAPSGMEFNQWAGDRDDIDINDTALYSSSITFNMPAQDVTWIATYKDIGSPLDAWPGYNYFCKKYFGAEKEPLQYVNDGNTLAFDNAANSEWEYASEESACIGFETTLPARTYIEYGLTASYGSTVYIEASDNDNRYYYNHLGYLTGLSNNTTYHYRFVAEDERSNTIYSSDKTLTTATPAGNVVYIPGSMGSPRYMLDSANTTYIVTQDINAGDTAFQIA
ncbi:hypothetical protein LCGC14_2614300, partial [marine sediment metagenome]